MRWRFPQKGNLVARLKLLSTLNAGARLQSHRADSNLCQNRGKNQKTPLRKVSTHRLRSGPEIDIFERPGPCAVRFHVHHTTE